MSALSADDLMAVAKVLQALTEVGKDTGISLDTGSLTMSTQCGTYLNARWDESDGGQYVLDLTHH